MLIIALPLFVCILGCFIYAFATNPIAHRTSLPRGALLDRPSMQAHSHGIAAPRSSTKCWEMLGRVLAARGLSNAGTFEDRLERLVALPTETPTEAVRDPSAGFA